MSVVVFLVWGGPLWSAAAGSSHVPRIAISYLLVIPLAAGMLALAGRPQRGHLVSAVALLWGAKLVITASLYSLLTLGAGTAYHPVTVSTTATARATAAPAGYAPAAQPGALATLSGVVLAHGEPIAGVVVFLEAPPPGLPLAPGREVRFTVGSEHGETLVASTRDRLLATNGGAALHTVRVSRDGQPTSNVPLQPGARAVEISASEPGTYAWSCTVHAGEVGGTIVVVDHPYATTSDASGRFALEGVPVGDREVAVARHGHAVRRRTAHVVGTAIEITIETEASE
ncbi:MAG: hypothetical protein WKG00_27945 [Polyangiaceae bacterium]